MILVTPEETRRLNKRFQRLDKDKSGGLTVDEFMAIPDVQDNPVLRRVVAIFDTDRNGEIDFQGMDSAAASCPLLLSHSLILLQ